jgi:hypothetical protein
VRTVRPPAAASSCISSSCSPASASSAGEREQSRWITGIPHASVRRGCRVSRFSGRVSISPWASMYQDGPRPIPPWIPKDRSGTGTWNPVAPPVLYGSTSSGLRRPRCGPPIPATTWSITPRPSRLDESPIPEASRIRTVSKLLAHRNTLGACADRRSRVSLSTYSTPDSFTSRTTESGRSVSRPVARAASTGAYVPGRSGSAMGSGAKRSGPTRRTNSSSSWVRDTGRTPMNASARS